MKCSPFPVALIDWFTPLQHFSDAFVDQLVATPWLTGIIFAPRWVRGFVEKLNGVNRDRAENGLTPLTPHMAIYTESFERYVRSMREGTSDGAEPLAHVNGLVYELSSDPAK